MFYLSATVAAPLNVVEHMYNLMPVALYPNTNLIAFEESKNEWQKQNTDHTKQCYSVKDLFLALDNVYKQNKQVKAEKKINAAICLQYMLPKQALIAQQKLNQNQIKSKHKFPNSKISSMSHRNGLKHG